MKNMGKYILIGIGAAFFLAFEMVICTGAILSKMDKKNDM